MRACSSCNINPQILNKLDNHHTFGFLSTGGKALVVSTSPIRLSSVLLRCREVFEERRRKTEYWAFPVPMNQMPAIIRVWWKMSPEFALATWRLQYLVSSKAIFVCTLINIVINAVYTFSTGIIANYLIYIKQENPAVGRYICLELLITLWLLVF